MKRFCCCIVVLLSCALVTRTANALSVLLVTANNGTLTTGESTIKSLFESSGTTVTTIWDGASQATFTAAYADHDLVYVPSSVTASDVSSKLRLSPIGVVNEHVGLMDELGLCSSAGSTTTVSAMSIATNSHYVTSPFAIGSFTIGSSTYAVARRGGSTASGAQALATVGGIHSTLVVDTGALLANTISSNSVAAGRRAQMPIQLGVVNISTLTSNMQEFLLRLIMWAATFNGGFEAHWKLNESSGTSAYDSSGSGRTGTVYGTSSWGAAIINNGFNFNGSTRIQATGLMGSPRNFTLAAWANLAAADSGGAEIVSVGDHFMLRLDESGATKAIFHNGSTYESVSVARTFAGTGWHHFAAVWDDPHNSFKLYIDGELAASATITTSVSFAGLGSNTIVGRHGNSGTTRDFTGMIDDVRIYGYTLTAQEVAQLFGLIGNWKLNETSGLTAPDATIFDRDATLTGTASWSTDCGGMRAFNFNGSSHYFTVAHHSDFQPTSMLSIAAWVRGDSWDGGTDVNTILRKGEANPNNFALAISDGRVELILDGNDGAGFRGNTVLSPGQWYHVAAVWDGATVKIYVNGQLDNTPATRTGTIGTDTRSLYVGGRAGTDFFDGMIRDVRLYNRQLRSAELVEMAGLVGYWRFAEGSGTTAADTSGLANNATLSGGASWTSDCAAGNNALHTNGTGGIAATATAFTPPAVGTVAFWMRSSGTPASTARIFGADPDWEVRQGPDGMVSFDMCGDATPDMIATVPLNESGRWYHVAVSFDSDDDSYAIYIDGQPNKSGTNSVAMFQRAPGILSFGTRTGSSEYWQGALRDFRVYNRKLCPVEVAELYGLGLHWKLDESSGTLAQDSSGTGRNGTVVGTPNWVTGAIDNAVQLDGTNRVEVTSLLGEPKNVTLAAWANVTATDPSGGELISLGDYFAIRIASGTVRTFFYNGSTWTNCSVNQSLMNSGWHHFAAVFNDDQNYCKLYIDGKESGSISTSVTIPYSGLGSKLVVGAHGNGQSTFDLSGKVDDVRVYTRALCPLEIQALHDHGSPFSGVRIIRWVEIQ